MSRVSLQPEYENPNMANLAIDATNCIIYLYGIWEWNSINEKYILKTLSLFNLTHKNNLLIDSTQITKMDTIGMFFINKIIKLLHSQEITATLKLNPDQKELFNRIAQSLEPQAQEQPSINNQAEFPIFTKITNAIIPSIIFIGQTVASIAQNLKKPTNLDWMEVTRTIKEAGLNGIFVVLLINFLIGATLTYEMAPQFTKYGANIFVVNFLGIAMLKEVSPLLTAIIIAGRTGSAITAEIGTMKVQEEIDAIRTMGISPFQKLVLPKIIGVVIATPLLTALADIIGMLGGAIIANNTLSITYPLFIERTQEYVSINNYTAGIIKSVTFGFCIALIGCIRGFMVKGDANSIGQETTKSVVISIITVIFLDAIFALIFLNLAM